MKLVRYEYDILVELEKQTGSIPVVSSINWGTFGLFVSNHHIIGLGSYNKGLTSLPKRIKSQLKKLKNNGCSIYGIQL